MHKVNRHKVGTDCSILLFKVSSLPSPMTILEIGWHPWLLLDSDTKLVLEKLFYRDGLISVVFTENLRILNLT